MYRYRVEETIARNGTESEQAGRVERAVAIEVPEAPLTDEEVARRMAKWMPYLAYIDDLISKALIQAASSRFGRVKLTDYRCCRARLDKVTLGLLFFVYDEREIIAMRLLFFQHFFMKSYQR